MFRSLFINSEREKGQMDGGSWARVLLSHTVNECAPQSTFSSVNSTLTE